MSVHPLIAQAIEDALAPFGARIIRVPVTRGDLRDGARKRGIAPVMVLATTRVTQAGDSQAIGLVNSSRVMAGFTGPVIATHLLVWYPSTIVFAVVGLASLACLPPVSLRWGRD